MYALWMFGTALERDGPQKVFGYYILFVAWTAGATQLFFFYVPAVGASGAIMGLLAGLGTCFPTANFLFCHSPSP